MSPWPWKEVNRLAIRSCQPFKIFQVVVGYEGLGSEVQQFLKILIRFIFNPG